jgi:lipopolysaccharide transport system ATP-binding protein
MGVDRDDVVLSVEGVSKKFCKSLRSGLLYGLEDIACEVVGLRRRTARLRRHEFWALRGVDFGLRRGEAMGLVGPNGAGKTTLLRILGGLIKPDQGIVRIRGRVAPLIALGAAFNPLLSGRENIHVNMAILGLSRSEIQARFAQVIEFADLGDRIDVPLQGYSSGMAARLGFACAIQAEPDILLIDEVLAVGDVAFRAKCYKRLADLRKRGTAFVLVSHNPIPLMSICEKAIYLRDGEVVLLAESDAVIKRYEEDLFPAIEEAESRPRAVGASLGLGADIEGVEFRDGSGKVLRELSSGDEVTLAVGVIAHRGLDALSLTVIIRSLSLEGQRMLHFESARDARVFSLEPGQFEFLMHLPYCGLAPGAYIMKVYLAEAGAFRVLDIVESFVFRVTAAQSMSECAFYQPRTWELVAREQ